MHREHFFSHWQREPTAHSCRRRQETHLIFTLRCGFFAHSLQQRKRYALVPRKTTSRAPHRHLTLRVKGPSFLAFMRSLEKAPVASPGWDPPRRTGAGR